MYSITKKAYIPFKTKIKNVGLISELNSSRSVKINLNQKEYKKNDSNFIFPSIKTAMSLYYSECSQRFGYLPLNGDQKFIRHSTKLLLPDSDESEFQNIAVNQTLGSTGGVLLGLYVLKFLYKNDIKNSIYVPNIINCEKIRLFKTLDFTPKFYNYTINEFTKTLDFEAFLTSLKKIKKGSLVYMEPINNLSCLSFESKQWKEISQLCYDRELMVFMNLHNFGLESGSFQNDAAIFNIFAQKNQLMVSVGLSGAFSLYGHGLGSLLVFNQSQNQIDPLRQFMAHITRNTYNFYPRYASDIANVVFDSSELLAQLKQDLNSYHFDLIEKKNMLIESLEKDKDFSKSDFFKKQKGMFLFTQLDYDKIQIMREKYQIDLMDNGLLNLSCITKNNVHDISIALNEMLKC
jgi:aspartate/tyrosine/aromatic aminotransferase